MRLRVSLFTGPRPEMARETVAVDTPARRATSSRLAGLGTEFKGGPGQRRAKCKRLQREMFVASSNATEFPHSVRLDKDVPKSAVWRRKRLHQISPRLVLHTHLESPMSI